MLIIYQKLLWMACRLVVQTQDFSLNPTIVPLGRPNVTEMSPTKTRHRLEALNNVGHVVSLTAQEMADEIAVAAPRKNSRRRPLQYDTISFGEVENKSNQIALGFQELGIQPGTRLALMVPPGLDFIAFVFGLFKAGMVVILIDPGMGKKNMVRCLSEAKPEGIVGIRLAHIMRLMFSGRFPDCKHNILVGGRWWPGTLPAGRFDGLNGDDFMPLQHDREKEAAIIFTTGSTGPPKGVLYRHRHFLEQAQQIQEYFSIQPGSVDVSGFPLFALFNCGMGTTTIFPKMDATRPAEVDPLDIKDAVDKFQATQSFGSPALWNTVSRFAEKTGLTFPTIKKVLSAGAPVPPHVLERVKSIIAEDGEVYTPYGATESLPIACNAATEVLNETAAKTAVGMGTCVGNKFPDIEWRIIEIRDNPIANMEDAVVLPVGKVGELIVKGAVVTDQYVTRTDANAEHKITDGDSFWHRMGDIGYLDEQNRFWFCGRKTHRVVTQQRPLFTIVVEGIINTHPHVYRSALVGLGQRGYQKPVVVIEPWPEHWPVDDSAQQQLIAQVIELCQSNEKTNEINTVLIKDKLPVDIRHNSKIFREQLTEWARTQC